MPDRTLSRIRSKVRAGRFVMTVHALEKMDQDDLTMSDVKNLLLKGYLQFRLVDEHTRERKFVVRGPIEEAGWWAAAVVKFGATGKLVIVTVYMA